MLRPGNAGSNTAADHVEAVRLALARLPRELKRRVLVRADSGGGTHEFLTWLTAPRRRPQYSVGFAITDDVQQAVAKVPARAWTPAYDAGGKRWTAASYPIKPATQGQERLRLGRAGLGGAVSSAANCPRWRNLRRASKRLGIR